MTYFQTKTNKGEKSYKLQIKLVERQLSETETAVKNWNQNLLWPGQTDLEANPQHKLKNVYIKKKKKKLKSSLLPKLQIKMKQGATAHWGRLKQSRSGKGFWEMSCLQERGKDKESEIQSGNSNLSAAEMWGLLLFSWSHKNNRFREICFTFLNSCIS